MSTVNAVADREERPPYVRFERKAIEDKPKSLEAGHYVGKDIDFALITPPYSKDCVEIAVDKWFKNQERNVMNNRTPRKWLEDWKGAYEAWKKGEEIPLNGTPIKTWQAVSPAQSATIIASGILTVEDLAACNDEGLRRLGMGGRDLVNKANSWLKGATSVGKVAIENAALTKEVTQLRDTVANLEEKVKVLKSAIDSKSTDEYEPQAEPTTITASDILEPSLADQYYAKFGKAPHWKMKEETIRKKLEE